MRSDTVHIWSVCGVSPAGSFGIKRVSGNTPQSEIDHIKQDIDINEFCSEDVHERFAAGEFSGEDIRKFSEKQDLQSGIQKFLEFIDKSYRLKDDFKLSPEASSIKNWLCDPCNCSKRIKILLFTSEDIKTFINALVTCFFIYRISQEYRAINITYRIYKNIPISIADNDSFNNGIIQLYKMFDEMRAQVPAGETLIINCTSGYKAVATYSTLYAQMHQIPCLYQFEGKKNALTLLPLPVSYDATSLDEEVNLIKALEYRDDLLKEYDEASFRPWLRALMHSGSSPLATMLQKFAASSKEHVAYGRALLEVLEEDFVSDASAYTGALAEDVTPRKKRQEEAEQWLKYLESRIRYEWAELWLGDQIPETVEHSRRHSKRLMELASYILRSNHIALHTLCLREPFFLALLISSIFLHDIGHTALVHPVNEKTEGWDRGKQGVFPLGMFPSCVREVHNLLSAEYLRGDGTSGKWRFFPDAEEEYVSALLPLLRLTVPYVCEHHRGYTTLIGNKGTPKGNIQPVGELLYGKNFEETLYPLNDRLKKDLGDNELFCKGLQALGCSLEDYSVKVVQVAAFLRVLDGCDVQADRTVSPAYLDARIRRTAEEGENIWFQLLTYRESAVAVLLSALSEPLGKDVIEAQCGKLWENLDRVHECAGGLMQYRGAAALDSDVSSQLKSACNAVYSEVLALLKLLKKDNACCALTAYNSSALMFLSLANKFAFKWEQFRHFYKHQAVEFVLPLVGKKKNTLVFTLWPRNLNNTAVDEKSITNKLEDIKKDIENEIAGTQGVLKVLGMAVDTSNSLKRNV